MTRRHIIQYKLEALPNLHGFAFRGVTYNGDLIDCIVLKGDDEVHRVFTDDINRNPAFNLLIGWMQHLPKNAN